MEKTAHLSLTPVIYEAQISSKSGDLPAPIRKYSGSHRVKFVEVMAEETFPSTVTSRQGECVATAVSQAVTSSNLLDHHAAVLIHDQQRRQ